MLKLNQILIGNQILLFNSLSFPLVEIKNGIYRGSVNLLNLRIFQFLNIYQSKSSIIRFEVDQKLKFLVFKHFKAD